MHKQKLKLIMFQLVIFCVKYKCIMQFIKGDSKDLKYNKIAKAIMLQNI